MLTLKIGRHEYQIQENDCFMDNGSCVQLLTQSKEKSFYGISPSPVLSKRAILEINKFIHNPVKHGYGQTVKVFSLSKNSNN